MMVLNNLSAIQVWLVPSAPVVPHIEEFSLVESLSCVWLFVTLWTAARQSSCPSPTPRVYSNSCPLSQWCHPTISSSVIPFSSHLQSFSASGSFPMSQLFAWGGQSIGVSVSTSVLPMNIQDWFALGFTPWLLTVQGTPKSLLQHHSSKACSLALSFLYSPTFTSIHDYWKNHSLD